MTILNPEHLLDQAIRLTVLPAAGSPRQVDVRRAISAAYYAVFHATLAAAADEFVGATKRSSGEYSLLYRSVDHRSLRALTLEVQKRTLSARYARHAPRGLGADLQAFAEAVLELQQKRHAADYDPAIRVKTSDALLAINTARQALNRLAHADAAERKTFLALLLFQPR